MILPFTTYLHYEAIYFYYMWHQWRSSHKSEALLKLDTFFFPPSFTAKREVCDRGRRNGQGHLRSLRAYLLDELGPAFVGNSLVSTPVSQNGENPLPHPTFTLFVKMKLFHMESEKCKVAKSGLKRADYASYSVQPKL